MATQLSEDQRGSSVNIKPRSATAPYEKKAKHKTSPAALHEDHHLGDLGASGSTIMKKVQFFISFVRLFVCLFVCFALYGIYFKEQGVFV
jgi:hypothetical protein